MSFITVFDLSHVSHHHVSHGDLNDVSFPHHGELLLLLDSTLQTPELFFFGPVVERRHQDDAHDGQQDGGALDPAGIGLPFVLCSRAHIPARWRNETEVGQSFTDVV